jgi:hypothetical protein
MVYKTSDKLIAYLTLFSGLTISAVAIYYSVAGLVAIFSAAVIPIIVMGVALEVSKLAATVWLKQNWTRAPNFIRGYLLAAIAILMLITSMGIFGFLSKAHSDQSLVSGDVQSKIAVYDEKIKTAKDNIDANRKALKQMDEAVDQVMGRSSDEKGADKAVALRRSQQKERTRLQSEIAAEQKIVASVSEERAPIAAEVRKVEAEVGPIKYIANFIYGDNPDANILEKAVTWVIIIIVIVFDPLAVILLLASQYSFQWFRKQEEEEPILATPTPVDAQNESKYEPNDGPLTDDQIEQIKEPFATIETPRVDPHPVGWMYPKHADIQNYQVGDADDEEFDTVEHTNMAEHARAYMPEEEKDIVEDIGLEQWNKMIEEAERELEKEKEAKRIWKEQNPDDTIKHQEKLKEVGIIEELPWKAEFDERPGDYISEVTGDRYKPNLTEVIEPDDSKKKTTYIVKENSNQITKTKE